MIELVVEHLAQLRCAAAEFDRIRIEVDRCNTSVDRIGDPLDALRGVCDGIPRLVISVDDDPPRPNLNVSDGSPYR